METAGGSSGRDGFSHLQWSHGPLAMETFLHCDRAIFWTGPSMEPWPFSHGNSVAVHDALKNKVPSMEPWPFSHGNDRKIRCRRLVLHPSMEPWPFSHGNQERSLLSPSPLTPSMEPWPFSHGNPLGQRMHRLLRCILQWSHGPLAMETVPSAAGVNLR